MRDHSQGRLTAQLGPVLAVLTAGLVACCSPDPSDEGERSDDSDADRKTNETDGLGGRESDEDAGVPDADSGKQDDDTLAVTMASNRIGLGWDTNCHNNPSTGRVECWGRRANNKNPPEGISFAAIGAGSSVACGLEPDGALHCWGSDGIEEGVPTGSYRSIGFSQGVVCALDASGELSCWGSFESRLRYPPLERYSAVSMGLRAACGIIAADGGVICWGQSEAVLDVPEELASGVRFVSVRRDHACALLSTGKATCWGEDTWGKSRAPSDTKFTSISTGDQHTCGIRESDRHVECWGSDESGQSSAPAGVEFEEVVSSGSFTCGSPVGDDRLLCWGQIPGIPRPGVAFSQVAIGSRFACAIRVDDAKVDCFALGEPVVLEQLEVPTESFSDLEAYSGTWCGLTEDQELRCWNTLDGAIWAPEGKFSTVSVGWQHACAMPTAGPPVVCWEGEELLDWEIPEESFVKLYSAGGGYTCGLNDDGEASCFGGGELPQLPPGERFLDLDIKEDFCGILESGETSCWRFDGGAVPSLPPLNIEFTTIDSRCGIRQDNGLVECWVYNGFVPRVEFSAVSITDGTGCGIRTDTGEIWCFGEGLDSVYGRRAHSSD